MHENLHPSIRKKVYKEEIGDERKIIRIVFQNKEFYFKSLTQSEYENLLLVSMNNKTALEENICQTALIEPKGYIFANSDYSGIPKGFSKIILENSLFMNPDKYKYVYQNYKNEMNDFKNQCIAIIKSQFSEFTFEEMEEWPLEKIFKYVARAEYVFNINKPEEQKMKLDLTNTFNETNDKSKKELHNEMILNGIDPVIYESQNIVYNNKDLKDTVFIGGIEWKNEEILNEIRGQMEKSNTIR